MVTRNPEVQENLDIIWKIAAKRLQINKEGIDRPIGWISYGRGYSIVPAIQDDPNDFIAALKGAADGFEVDSVGIISSGEILIVGEDDEPRQIVMVSYKTPKLLIEQCAEIGLTADGVVMFGEIQDMPTNCAPFLDSFFGTLQ